MVVLRQQLFVSSSGMYKLSAAGGALNCCNTERKQLKLESLVTVCVMVQLLLHGSGFVGQNRSQNLHLTDKNAVTMRAELA